MPDPLRDSLATSILLTSTALAQAGGVYLPENGGPSNGTALAGSAAVAPDAETRLVSAKLTPTSSGCLRR